MSKTKIEWATDVWNPVTGCTKISIGCENCYAERMAKRLAGRFGYSKDDPFQVTLHTDRLDEPLSWQKPRRIFVCSMGDLFHKDVLDGWIAAMWSMMAATPQHTYLILTKRPKRMKEFLNATYSATPGGELDFDLWDQWRQHNKAHDHEQPKQPLPNVWLGVTVENDKYLWRIDELLKIRAAVHFVSLEPLLGPVDSSYYMEHVRTVGSMSGAREIDVVSLDWVIAGCESGPNRRPAKIEWFRAIRDQCTEADVPFFLKQMDQGGPIPIVHMPLLDERLWDQVPETG